MQRYQFVSGQNRGNLNYNPKKTRSRFYQICNFKDPNSQLYNMRVSEFDQLGNYTRSTIRTYNDAELKQFFEDHRPNTYKLFAASDLNLVRLPNMNDVNETQSELLNSDHTEYGYANF